MGVYTDSKGVVVDHNGIPLTEDQLQNLSRALKKALGVKPPKKTKPVVTKVLSVPERTVPIKPKGGTTSSKSGGKPKLSSKYKVT